MLPPLSPRLYAASLRLQRTGRRSPEERQRACEEAVDRLRAFAAARSPFYRELHAGFENRPLDQLPILTPAMLRESFDSLVTDPSLRYVDLRARLAAEEAGHGRRARYRVSRTAAGEGIIVHDPGEWALLVASHRRAWRRAGLAAGRLAVVSGRTPAGSRAFAAVAGLSSVLRLPHDDALIDIVQRLNDLQPASLVADTSVALALAEEQIAAHLQIGPQALICTSLTLSDVDRRRLRDAFGVAPRCVLGSPETGALGAECGASPGVHLDEDLAIVETVDEANRPVPTGEPGAKILVTVLFGRTVPLIRYEIAEPARLLDGPCRCGRDTPRLDRLGDACDGALPAAGEPGGPPLALLGDDLS